jgi:hypothetical protein
MAVAAPARRTAPAPAPSRTAPPRKRTATPRVRPTPRRKAAQPALALAGRTAVAVGQLPDSGLIVRMTRGRAWIGVLGVLLVGIVGLNVLTLSFAASSGKIDQQNTVLEKEKSILEGREARLYSTARVRNEGSSLGLTMASTEAPLVVDGGPKAGATPAARLAAAGAG